MKYRMVGFLGLFLWLASGALPQAQGPTAKVNLLRTPNGGIQPQALMDERGTLHLIYLSGEASASDVFYVQRAKGQTGFSCWPQTTRY